LFLHNKKVEIRSFIQTRILLRPKKSGSGSKTLILGVGIGAGVPDLHQLFTGEGIPNLKICNTGRLLADSELWINDPVHPSQEGYERVVRFIIHGLADMASKKKKLSSDDSDLEDSMPQKKQKTEDGMERMPPPRFRPAWTSSTGNFVSPTPNRPYNFGRVSAPGRRFGRGGGRRPYY
jgi:hypothetical protein